MKVTIHADKNDNTGAIEFTARVIENGKVIETLRFGPYATREAAIKAAAAYAAENGISECRVLTAKKVKYNYITRLTSKPDTQAQIRALRAAGYPCRRDNCGVYRATVTTRNTEGFAVVLPVFTAMRGNHGYLVRRVSDLFA